jgi:serine/threonine-protein kinase HipA
MSPKEPLSVYLSGKLCGTLAEDRHGAISFAYSPEYQGVPLSLSMPVGLAAYKDRVIRPFLMGLLPDDESTRASIAAPHGISADNPFRLLEIIGMDCPGAVQVCASQGQQLKPETAADLRTLSDGEIAEKLKAVKQDAASAWTGAATAAGHWSLGGCQAKFALRRMGETWCECTGAAATTHILKPGVAGYDHQALVEFLSMKIAYEVGIPVANVDYRLFDDQPAIVIERYDRYVRPDGRVERIHQEDMCQALSVYPASKYAEQGGPATPDIIGLLRKTGQNSRENVHRFILYLFFNYLIGATDAHAKNHSLLFVAPGDVRLAPLYDVASIAPYVSLRPTQRKPVRAALSIGGENRFGKVGARSIAKMVETCRLDELDLGEQLLHGQMKAMAEMLPAAVDNVLKNAKDQQIPGMEHIADSLRSEIQANCERTLHLL